MKKLITILLFFLSITSYGQERLQDAEEIIFRMINEYRISEGLKTVKWSNKVYNAAYHHSSYMSNKGVPYAHTETVDVDGHEEINNPQVRIEKYCGPSSWGTECIAGLPLLSWTVEPWDLEKACRTVVNNWINSPGHKKAILYDKEGNGNLTIGAVSVIKLNYCESSIPVLVLVNK